MTCSITDGIQVERVVVNEYHHKIRKFSRLHGRFDPDNTGRYGGIDNVGISNLHDRALGNEQFGDATRWTFSRITSVFLVGQTEQQDPPTFYRKFPIIEVTNDSINNVIRHVIVHVIGQLHKTK